MCLKKINKWIDKNIKKEKIIRIRERKEKIFERQMGIVLAVLLTGNLFAGVKSLYPKLITAIIVLILLGLYLFFEIVVIKRYSVYTDKLIKKKQKN